MSKKDFDNYMIKMKAQYEEMKRNLEIVAKEAQDNPSDLDFVERLRQDILPFKQNYERLVYIKTLLDRPNKKDKKLKYNRMLIKKLKELEEKNSTESVLQENKEVISKIASYINKE